MPRRARPTTAEGKIADVIRWAAAMGFHNIAAELRADRTSPRARIIGHACAEEKAMIYGYTRVSTDAQDLSNQVAQLKAAKCCHLPREDERRDCRAAPAQEADGEARCWI